MQSGTLLLSKFLLLLEITGDIIKLRLNQSTRFLLIRFEPTVSASLGAIDEHEVKLFNACLHGSANSLYLFFVAKPIRDQHGYILKRNVGVQSK